MKPLHDMVDGNISQEKLPSEEKKTLAAEADSSAPALERQSNLEARERRKELAVLLKKKMKKTHHLLQQDKDYHLMRKPFRSAFYLEWNKGLKAYLQGNWDEAKTHFTTTMVKKINSRIWFLESLMVLQKSFYRTLVAQTEKLQKTGKVSEL